jgi:uncharacterized repeat protein (TIGR01451 family)
MNTRIAPGGILQNQQTYARNTPPCRPFARWLIPTLLSGVLCADLLNPRGDVVPLTPAPAAANVPAEGLLTWSASGSNLVVNGDFETGDFTGWGKQRTMVSDFVINQGAYKSPYTGAPEPTFSGRSSAVTTSTGTATQALVQDISIPANAACAVLSWADRIRNFATNYSNSNQQFRVEIRDTDNRVRAQVFGTAPGDPLLQEWTRRSVDLSAFIGQKVRLAFVEANDLGLLNVHLDEIRLEVTTSASPVFQVLLERETDLGPTNLLGITRSLLMRYANLLPGARYRWQVASIENGVTHSGPVRDFVVGDLGPCDHFVWGRFTPPGYPSVPFPASLTGKDVYQNTVTDFSNTVTLAALAESIRPASILITELYVGSIRCVEFMNLSSTEVDVTGWQISVYDIASWPEPRFTFMIPSNSIVRPGGNFVIQNGIAAPGRLPILLAGSDIAWGNAPSNSLAAVLLRDRVGFLVDFVCIGAALPSQIVVPVPIPISEWYGPSVQPVLGKGSYQRIGNVDHQNCRDWAIATSSLCRLNAGCSASYLPGPGALAVSPQTISNFLQGVWQGSLTFGEPADAAILIADDGQGHAGTFGPLHIEPLPKISLAVPAWVDEGAGMMVRTGSLQLPVSLATNLTVGLVSNHPELLSVPASIEILAGETNIPFDLFVADNTYLDGTRLVELGLHAFGFQETVQKIRVRDDETAVLALQLPAQAREGDAPVPGIVSVDRAVARDCLVDLTVSDPTQVAVPGQVVIPAGQTNVTFDLKIIDDNIIETNQFLVLQAEVANWTSAQAEILIEDNESRALQLKLPSSVDSLSGTLARSGQVALGGVLPSPLAVTLTTTPGANLNLPPTVIIPVGQSNVLFDIGTMTNTAFLGAHASAVTAAAPGFSSASVLVEVTDERLEKMILPAADLAYDAPSGRLYATVPNLSPGSNGLIDVIDPESAFVERFIVVDDAPGALALTDDGDFLYVTVKGNTAIQRVNLSSLTAEAPFPIAGPIFQLAAVPGHPNQVLVCEQLNIPYYFQTSLVLYEGGNALSNTVPGIIGFTPSGQTLNWMGWGLDGSINRIVADASGLQVIASSRPSARRSPLVEAGGVLYAADGHALDSASLTELPGIGGAIGELVAADAGHGRIFFLGDPVIVTGGSRGKLVLAEADLSTRLIGKSLTFRYQESFHSLVRWGEGGLAFVMDGQVCLLRTSLVGAGSSVDLSCTATFSAPPLTVGSNYTISFAVSNAGPATATSVQFNATLPAEFRYIGGTASQGTITNRNGTLSGALGHLPEGTCVNVSLEVQPQKAGLFTLSSALRAAQQDSEPANNQVALDLTADYADRPDSANQVVLTTADVVYDPATDRLFATVPAAAPQYSNFLVQIDPARGTIERQWFLGGDPGKMTQSPDGQYLYIVLNDQSAILPFQLPAGTAGPSFPWGMGLTNPLWRVADLKALAGSSQRIAVSFVQNQVPVPSGETSVVIYESGMPLPKTSPYGGLIDAALDGQTLYVQYAPSGTEFFRLKVASDGLELIDFTPYLFGGPSFVISGEQIYADSGQVFSKQTLTQEAYYAGLTSYSLVLPVPELGRVLFLEPSSQGAYGLVLRVYDAISGRMLTDAWSGGDNENPTRLLRCGADRVAFPTTGGQIYIIRTSLLPAGPMTDLKLDWGLTPGATFVGSNQVVNLTISNVGTNTAQAAQFILELPDTVGASGATVSQGVCANAQSVVRGYLGAVPVGHKVEAAITIQAGYPGLFPANVRVFSSSLESATADNYAQPAIRVGTLLGADQTVGLRLPNAGIAYEKRSRRLFASLPSRLIGSLIGDSIVEIDPALCLPGVPVAVGKDPGPLVLSADGQSLYVVLAGENAIQQLDLAARALGTKYPLLEKGGVTDMAANPVRPAQLLFTQNGKLFGIEGGTLQVKLGCVGGFPFTSVLIAFSEDGTRLAVGGTDFFGSPAVCMFAATNSTLILQQAVPSPDGMRPTIKFVGERLFAGSGVVVDANSLQPLAPVHFGALLPDVVPVPGTSRAFYLSGFNSCKMTYFDWSSQQELASGYVLVDNLRNPPCFTAWGADGLAWRTTDNVYIARTSLMPLVPGRDTDGDGMPDIWEASHNLNCDLASDALRDDDGDGASNYAEYVAGTDPANPTRVLRILKTSLQQGTLVLTVATAAGRSYVVEARSDMNPEQWLPVSDSFTANGETENVGIPVPASGVGFYRLVTLAPVSAKSELSRKLRD